MVVLTPAGHAVHRNDPYLTMPAVTPAPAAAAVTAATKPKARERTVRTELVRLRNSRAITPTQYRLYNGSFSAALASEKRLRGTRRTELEAVVDEPPQHRRLRRAVADPAAGAVPDPGPQPPVVDDRSNAGVRAEGRVQRLGAGLAVLPGPGDRAPGARHVRQGRRPVHRRQRRVPAAGRSAVGDDPAGRDARRRPDLGVLLQVRRRDPAVDERDVPGHRSRGAHPWLPGDARCVLPSDRRAGPADLLHGAEGGRQRTDAARRALPAVLIRARHRHHQRVPAVADRPLRLRADERQHAREGAVRRRQHAGSVRAAADSTPAPGRCTSRAWRTT